MEHLFRRLRNQMGHWKSEEFLNFIRQLYPDKDPHHLLGSFGPLKVSDLLIAPLDRIEHRKADLQREEYFLIYLPFALNLVQKYITKLEKENEQWKSSS